MTRHVIQGEQCVSEDPQDVLATLLGSCVAACLHDPVAGIGGMNHFLLPGDAGGGERSHAERYGVHAMELLVNALLARGAARSRLEAKLFGGASTMQGLSDIGAMNAAFAKRFLQRETIRITSECLGGRAAAASSTGRSRGAPAASSWASPNPCRPPVRPGPCRPPAPSNSSETPGVRV